MPEEEDMRALNASVVTASLFAIWVLLPNVGQAQEAKVKTAMELLESKANKLGPPRIDFAILLN